MYETGGMSRLSAAAWLAGRPSCGPLVAALLFFATELWLHVGAFLLQFRSASSARRAVDKVAFAQGTAKFRLYKLGVVGVSVVLVTVEPWLVKAAQRIGRMRW